MVIPLKRSAKRLMYKETLFQVEFKYDEHAHDHYSPGVNSLELGIRTT